MEDRSYYTRKADPLGHFANDFDRRNEKLVTRELEKSWGCEVRPFGPLSPIDLCLLELKSLESENGGVEWGSADRLIARYEARNHLLH